MSRNRTDMERWEKAAKIHLLRAPMWLRMKLLIAQEAVEEPCCYKCGWDNRPVKSIDLLDDPYFEAPVKAPVRMHRCRGPHTQDRWVCAQCVVEARRMKDFVYPVFEVNFAPYTSYRDGKCLPICEMCFRRRRGEFVEEQPGILSLTWKCACEKKFADEATKRWFCHECSIQYYDRTVKDVIREAVRNYDLVSRKLETEDAVVCGSCDLECIPREELVSFSPRWYMCAGCRTPRIHVVEDPEDYAPPGIIAPPPSDVEEPYHVLNDEDHSRWSNLKRVLYLRMGFHVHRPTEVSLTALDSTLRKQKIFEQEAVEASSIIGEAAVDPRASDGHLAEDRPAERHIHGLPSNDLRHSEVPPDEGPHVLEGHQLHDISVIEGRAPREYDPFRLPPSAPNLPGRGSERSDSDMDGRPSNPMPDLPDFEITSAGLP